MNKLLWPGMLIVLIGSLVAVDVTMLVIATNRSAMIRDLRDVAPPPPAPADPTIEAVDESTPDDEEKTDVDEDQMDPAAENRKDTLQ